MLTATTSTIAKLQPCVLYTISHYDTINLYILQQFLRKLNVVAKLDSVVRILENWELSTEIDFIHRGIFAGLC